MATPDIPSSSIEQAIYTWSEINRGGNKGLGFGAVSPGLRHHSDWLAAWPTSRLQLREESLRGAEAFVGWEQAVTVGAFALDAFNVVYRKIPSAGLDGVGRNRPVVHALVAHHSVLDLSRIASDAAIWYSAEDCPLDALPALHTLSSTELVPPSFAHGSDEHGDVHTLLERLVLAGPALVLDGLTPEDIARLTRSLHVAIPTALWPNVELTCRLAGDGLRATVTVASRPPAPACEPAALRRDRVGLGDCALHGRVDDLWLAGGQRSWPRFARSLTPRRLAEPAALLPAGDQAGIAQANGRRRAVARRPDPNPMRELVADAIGWPDWDFDRGLDDLAISRLLAAHGIGDTVAAWLPQATGEQLRAVLAHVRERRTYAALAGLLWSSGVSAQVLVAAWKRSVAAPLGYALAERSAAHSLGRRWALPSAPAADHAHDAAMLAEQLVTSEAGHDACIAMFRAGILRHPEWRAQMIRGLLSAKASPQFVFERLMTEAGADQRILCQVALEHLDEFAAWLKLPEPYREAFRTGLARPRWFWRLTHVRAEPRPTIMSH